MHEAGSWVATSQWLLPILAGIIMIVTMKWMSRQWTAQTMARTARVASRLRESRGSRAFRR